MNSLNEIRLAISSSYYQDKNRQMIFDEDVYLTDEQMIELLKSCAKRLEKWWDYDWGDAYDNLTDEEKRRVSIEIPVCADLQGRNGYWFYLSDCREVLWEGINDVVYAKGITIGDVIFLREKLEDKWRSEGDTTEGFTCGVDWPFDEWSMKEDVEWFIRTERIVHLAGIDKEIVPLLEIIKVIKDERKERLNAQS